MATKEATFRVYKGDAAANEMKEFKIPVEEGMVVLDAIHYIQGYYDQEYAVRWNCKAAKCGSCSGEVNGMPSLMCKTRLDHLDLSKPVEVRPLATFPVPPTMAVGVLA